MAWRHSLFLFEQLLPSNIPLIGKASFDSTVRGMLTDMKEPDQPPTRSTPSPHADRADRAAPTQWLIAKAREFARLSEAIRESAAGCVARARQTVECARRSIERIRATRGGG